ncbi:MAG: alpha-ketoglutarate-dependent dioxygenase AlkB [Actinomycetota bacterium]|nr:alpha-ketoglutarate-dependent dioxygenase AlkB [Actinomycetota bacterium]
MGPPPDLTWQPTLFDADAPGFDQEFSSLRRVELDPTAWVDYAPAWVGGSDQLFSQVLEERDWGQRSRRMYEGRVVEPRLTAPWNARSGEELRPPLLEDIRQALSAHYGIEFDSVGFNLYRDGRDSVAWHGDHIKKEIEEPLVALVSLGEPRRFLLRPKGGGKSRAFMLGRGDLLVTGGKTQRTWEHSVPKVAQAGPRISLAYRHGLDPAAYAHKKKVEDEP